MSVDYGTNPSLLADRWPMILGRGIVAILFGIVAIMFPGLSLLSLVMLWGTYALVDGVLNLLAAPINARSGRRWGWLLFEGIASIAAGLMTFVWPGITTLVVLMVIAARAVLGGIAEIFSAVRLRHQIEDEWWLASAGALSVSFGVLMFLFPRAGALGLLWVIAVYAIAFGSLLVGLGLKLNRWGPASD
jgi:uncharacterized membrane protein HdeD (DUF308 family)